MEEITKLLLVYRESLFLSRLYISNLEKRLSKYETIDYIF